MNIFRRFYNFVYAIASRLLDRVESPEAKFQNFIKEMNSRVTQIRDSVAAAIVEEKRMRSELEQLRQKAISWEQRAVLALQEGQEPLVRAAVVERQKVERLGAELHQAWTLQQRTVEELKSRFEAIRARTTSARAEFQISMARYQTAMAQKSLNESSAAGEESSATHMLDQFNDQILRLESEAEATNLLSGGEDHAMETTFQAIELNRSVDQEIESLRLKLNANTAKAELPE